MSAVSFEYDPHNKLRHIDYWYEESAAEEWPRSHNADWEEPVQDGEVFDYDAGPNRFYFDVEGVGQIPPQEILEQGIKYLQEKLAQTIQGIAVAVAEDKGIQGAFAGGARSPGHAHPNRGGEMPGPGERDQQGDWDAGYATPFQSGGRTSYEAWNGGQTPYGQPGW